MFNKVLFRLEFERRVVRRLPLHKFSTLCHVPHTSITLMEKGRLVPTDVELQLMAQVLEVAPSELMKPVQIGYIPLEKAEA